MLSRVKNRILETSAYGFSYLALMRLSTSVITLRLLALAALGVLGVFIFGVDPVTLTIAGQGVFFSSLMLCVAALLALGLLALARRFLDERAAEAYVPSAFRQGLLLGLYVACLALSQFLGYFAWWLALLAFALVLLIEFTVRQFQRP